MKRIAIGLFLVTMMSGAGAGSGLTGPASLMAAQSTLAGTWQGQTENGASLTLVLTVTGTALTGTLDRNGEVAKLMEGTVSKNTFTFKVTLNGESETIEGTWEKDEVKAWLARQGPERTVVFKRAK